MNLITLVQRESTEYSYNEPTPTVYQISIKDIESTQQGGKDYVNLLLVKELPFNSNVNRSVLNITASLGPLNKRIEMIELIESLENIEDEETEVLYEVLTNPINNVEKANEFEGIFFSDKELTGYRNFANSHGISSNDEKRAQIKALFEKVKISNGAITKARKKMNKI